MYHANTKKKRNSYINSDKADLRIKKATGDKSGHYIKIKGLSLQEGIIMINVYAHKSLNT